MANEAIRQMLIRGMANKGMSDPALAERLNVVPSTVTCWAQGKKTPRIEAVAQMVKMGVLPKEILTEIAEHRIANPVKHPRKKKTTRARAKVAA